MTKHTNITTVLPFILEEASQGIKQITIVELGWSPLQIPPRSAEDQTQALIEAVTTWVRRTTLGMDCWRESKGDLNIGDLTRYDFLPIEFNKWLSSKQAKELDFKLRSFKVLWIGETKNGSMYFDRLLTEGIENPKETN